MELEWIGDGEREKNKDEKNTENKAKITESSAGEVDKNAVNSEAERNSRFGMQSRFSEQFLENSKWLKTNETAEYLRTSPEQIRKWVYQGRLKSYKLLGKSLRFKKTDLDLLFKGDQAWE